MVIGMMEHKLCTTKREEKQSTSILGFSSVFVGKHSEHKQEKEVEGEVVKHAGMEQAGVTRGHSRQTFYGGFGLWEDETQTRDEKSPFGGRAI